MHFLVACYILFNNIFLIGRINFNFFVKTSFRKIYFNILRVIDLVVVRHCLRWVMELVISVKVNNSCVVSSQL